MRCSVAAVCGLLEGLRLSSLQALDPVASLGRYERGAPSVLLHIDTKKLGCIMCPGHGVAGDSRDSVDGAGWEFVRVAIDEHSRVGFVQRHEMSARIRLWSSSKRRWCTL